MSESCGSRRHSPAGAGAPGCDWEMQLGPRPLGGFLHPCTPLEPGFAHRASGHLLVLSRCWAVLLAALRPALSCVSLPERPGKGSAM